jgi:hypothetical protein
MARSIAGRREQVDMRTPRAERPNRGHGRTRHHGASDTKKGTLLLGVLAAAALTLAGCLPGSSAAQPTPIVVYVTPPPAAVTSTATPAPTPTVEPTPTPEPTAEPTPTPKPEPIAYNKLNSRNWSKVVKSPDTYTGKTYQIWGCIFQFDAATGDEHFLAQASYRNEEYWWSDGENAAFTGAAAKLADFVEEDIVVMNVVSTGAYSYDTQAGGNTSVPSFDVIKITRKGSCA